MVDVAALQRAEGWDVRSLLVPPEMRILKEKCEALEAGQIRLAHEIGGLRKTVNELRKTRIMRPNTYERGNRS